MDVLLCLCTSVHDRHAGYGWLLETHGGKGMKLVRFLRGRGGSTLTEYSVNLLIFALYFSKGSLSGTVRAVLIQSKSMWLRGLLPIPACC